MKLVWTKEVTGRDDCSHMGRLPNALPMTLFIITRSAGGFALSGAFVPDGLDGEEYRRLEQAKEAAQSWMSVWVADFTLGWRGKDLVFSEALRSALKSVLESDAPLCRAHSARDVMGLVTLGFEAAWRGLTGETEEPLAVQSVVKQVICEGGD